MLRTGRLRPSALDMDSWMAEILNQVEKSWTNLKRFYVVIATGGGASLLGNRLSQALTAKGASVYWPEDPVTSNVIGLWKWGAYGSRGH